MIGKGFFNDTFRGGFFEAFDKSHIARYLIMGHARSAPIYNVKRFDSGTGSTNYKCFQVLFADFSIDTDDGTFFDIRMGVEHPLYFPGGDIFAKDRSFEERAE